MWKSQTAHDTHCSRDADWTLIFAKSNGLQGMLPLSRHSQNMEMPRVNEHWFLPRKIMISSTLHLHFRLHYITPLSTYVYIYSNHGKVQSPVFFPTYNMSDQHIEEARKILLDRGKEVVCPIYQHLADK
jgi:hypothetical protein